jgi:putative cell wall-binding protein
MMWKKGVALLFGLMVVAATMSFGRVSAGSTSVTVILVSDNEADCALAEYLANVTGAIVVTTEWGTYNPNVTAEIMSYAPDNVIIIGGPDAVVEQYVDDLQELGITVERWWGKNRYETNVAVIGNATVRLKIKFENSVIIVPGNDSGAIKEALRRAVKIHGIIIFVNETTDPIRVMAKFQIMPKNVTIIHSHVMMNVAEKIRERMKIHANVTEIKVNVTPEMALEAINVSEERVATAKEMLQNVSLDAREEKLVSRMLALAERELENAKDAYEMGKYGRAYGQAIAAKAHAEFVIRVASDEWEVKVRFEPTMRAMMFLHKVEIQIGFMERAGINVTELRILVDQLRTAIENEDYDAIDVLIVRIREKLLELYMENNNKLREKIVFPVRRRSGRP